MLSIGIDAGLETLKIVALDQAGVKSRLVLEAGRESIAALVKTGMDRVLGEVGPSRDGKIKVAVTGRGAAYTQYGDAVLPETTCCARGLAALYGDVRTLIDMGAEKCVVMKLQRGRATRIARNERCAAGSGRFLRMVAKLMMIPIDEIGRMSLSSTKPVEVQSTCAVFAESEIISLIHQKHKPEDILSGVFSGLVMRVYPLLQKAAYEPPVAIIGGVSKNIGVVRAFEELLELKLVLPEYPDTIQALGAALMASERVG